MIKLKTNYGDISIKLDEENTPQTAANFLKLATDGFYNGAIFHRVINGFMIQGGGFEPGMQPKPHSESIENEADRGQANQRGSIAMARTSDPHSASSQFFINLVDNTFLNHQSKSSQGWGYCVFGHVIEGMEVVDAISKVATTSVAGHQDVPTADVIISQVEVLPRNE